MTKLPQVFIDSDVFISSLISQKGAAYFLIHKANLKLFLSNRSIEEIKIVVKELKLKSKNWARIISLFNIIPLLQTKEKIKNAYGHYVFDINDSHIIAGAQKAKVKYLISYNLKHFKIEEIKRNFKIECLTPAQFLQYLRSINLLR